MAGSNLTSDVPENGSGQFSKFSINQDRPTKRRRNVKEAEAGPIHSPIGPDASAVSKQTENKEVAPRSCAECRRMKLKCDRIFPCKTCVRRGLEGICPEGSLVTGRGTRYVLASTQELHEKILRMADRIKTLEDALGTLHEEHAKCRSCSCQATPPKDHSPSPHPLLQSELLLIKGQLELYGLGLSKDQSTLSPCEQPSLSESPPSSQDAPRTASPRPSNLSKKVSHVEADDGNGSTNPTEFKRNCRVLQEAHDGETPARKIGEGKRKRHTKESPVERGRRLRGMLPSRNEAEYLVREAIWHGAWILNITSRPGNRAKLLNDLYFGPVEDVRAQDVALILAALALGERVDLGPASLGRSSSNYGLRSSPGPSAGSEQAVDSLVPDATQDDVERGEYEEFQKAKADRSKRDTRPAQESYNLAKAALSDMSEHGEPDQTVVHCLYLMAWYLTALSDNKDAGREATIVVGLAIKIAFKIGMHLEETYSGLSAEAQQERRILFWSLLHLESRLRLDASCLGALGTMKITTKRPFTAIPGAIKSFATHTEAVFHDFKLAFLEECIVPTLSMVEKAPRLRLKENDYYDVLALDRRIRDFELPPVLAEPIGAPPPPDPCEFLPVGSHCDLDFILNPSTNVSSFNLSYGGGKAPRNVLRMLRVKAQQEKLITLLYLHRTFFYAHIRDHRPLVQRMFLPSCLASFSAACALLRTAKEIHTAEPELAARVSMLWYNAFIGTITLFLLVVYKPFCPVSIIALQEMESVKNVFLAASTKCHMAAQSYPMLREFHAKASEVYNRWRDESEGELNVFGPNGEVTFCQTRLDVVIERLQCVPVPSSDEADATTGLLSLKKCVNSSLARQGGTCDKSPPTPCSANTGNENFEGTSYEMWQHVHKEITDFVRRVPEVLRDAAVDPRRATAARLIWGFIPLPDEPNAEDMTIVEEPEFGVGLPSDLDWNAFADALMFAPTAHPENLIAPSSSKNLGLLSPPATTYSPESSQSSFSLLDLCSDFEFGGTGFTPEINMDGTWAVSEQNEGLAVLPDASYGGTPSVPLRSDFMLESIDGELGYSLYKSKDTLQNAGDANGGVEHNSTLPADSGESDCGTLGYLWQHRISQAPYLS